MPQPPFYLDPALDAPAPKPRFGDPDWNENQFFQDVLDGNPSGPVAQMIMQDMGLVPSGNNPYATTSVANQGFVRNTQAETPEGDPWGQVTHGNVAGPRRKPSDETDPYFQEGYGITDEMSPWLIQPGQHASFGGGGDRPHQYGILAQNPIHMPPAAGPRLTGNYSERDDMNSLAAYGNQTAGKAFANVMGVPQQKMPYQRDWGPGNK